MRNISPLILNCSTSGSFVTFQHWRFFVFRTSHNTSASSDPPPPPTSTPSTTRPFHYQEAESLCSSCFPLCLRAPSRGSSLVIFPPPETAQRHGDGLLSLRLAQGNKRRATIHRRLRREPGQPTRACRGPIRGAGRALLPFIPRNAHLLPTVFRGNVEKVVFTNFNRFGELPTKPSSCFLL